MCVHVRWPDRFTQVFCICILLSHVFKLKHCELLGHCSRVTFDVWVCSSLTRPITRRVIPLSAKRPRGKGMSTCGPNLFHFPKCKKHTWLLCSNVNSRLLLFNFVVQCGSSRSLWFSPNVFSKCFNDTIWKKLILERSGSYNRWVLDVFTKKNNFHC